jgi:hypothetical protein
MGRLTRRLELAQVGMSGHSLGAVTTEAVSGEIWPLLGIPCGNGTATGSTPHLG